MKSRLIKRLFAGYVQHNMTQNNIDSEPFRKPGKVLDSSEYNQIADTSSETVESAIASLRRAGMVKTASLIEAMPENNG